ncbi:MAG TPA: hypothetical protein VGD67_25770 [Pseudonocardiaceae bacterium]
MMSVRPARRITRAVAMAILSLLAPVVLFTGSASAAGSGTVSDPWVPMRSATVVCQSATLWGNYSGGSHSNPIATYYYGAGIGVRYITGDGRSAMVHPWGDGWGFMLRSCIQFR